MQRPLGIAVIALLFCTAGVYLWVLGATLLISPGTLSLMAGRQLMYGLELAGPYMALLVGSGYALVGVGLFRLHNWARWIAMLVMVISVASLVPRISMAELGVPVLWYGLQIALRVAAGWYLAQAPAVVDAFAGKP
ncbi:MAG TPA: hypothetical protein VE377_24800 [Candidatus Dormibacteraeota bacterium]|nr:hypothetical protein [Candidatus Dormibacteraeota bacterium]